MKKLFTSESVTEGHPDKICDQVSDAILDALYEKDPQARVACEALVTRGVIYIAGEITTSCYIEIPRLVRNLIREIGYNDPQMGFDYGSCGVITAIQEQSPDIARGVDTGGAGDQGCIKKGALVKTDKGFLPIEKIKKDMLVVTPYGLRKVLGARKTGVKKIVELTFSNGMRLECTPQHRILCYSRDGKTYWKEASRLDCKDFICILKPSGFNSLNYLNSEVKKEQFFTKYNHKIYGPPKTTLNEDLAYVIGLLIGDGSSTSEKLMEISFGRDKNQALAVKKILDRNFPNQWRLIHTKEGFISLKADSVLIRRHFENFGVGYNTSAQKVTPEAIFISPKNVIKAYLKGLFDSDGTIVSNTGRKRKNIRIRLGSTSYRLLEETQLLLNEFRIKSSILFNTPKGIPVGKDKRYKSKYDSFVLSLVGFDSYQNFGKEIGFAHFSKKERLEEYLKNTPTKPKNSPSICLIPHPRKKEMVGEELMGKRLPFGITKLKRRIEMDRAEVYDLEIEEVNIFSANGIFVHNSMIGYACRQTKELMPLPIMLAHKLVRRLSQVRRQKILDYLRPDGKSQVTVEYEGSIPKRISAVIVGAHHNPTVKTERLREDIKELVIDYVLPPQMVDKNTKIFINATGRFEVGGPVADTGVTGRKIMVDTYGGWARHGGGCFCIRGDTLINTEKGLMEIKGMKEEVKKGIKVKTDIHPHQARKWFDNGFKETIRLVTSCGYELEGTPNQRIRIIDKEGKYRWQRLDKLKKDDYIAIQIKNRLFGEGRLPPFHYKYKEGTAEKRKNKFFYPSHLTEDYAYLLGLLIGDGRCNCRDGIWICVCEKEQKERVGDLFKRLFGRGPEIFGHWAFMGGVELRAYLEHLGLGFWKAENKEVPKSVYLAPQNVVAAFLRGFFDTDGSVCIYGRNRNSLDIKASSISPKLIKGIQQLLLNFGIISDIVKIKKKGERFYINGVQRRSRHDIYYLHIKGGISCRIFKEKIGFGLGRKQKILEKIKLEGKRNYFIIPHQRERVRRLWMKLPSRAHQKDIIKIGRFTRSSNGKATKHLTYSKLEEFLKAYKDNFRNNKDFLYLKRLFKMGHFYDRVEKIEESSAYTYDLYVPSIHTFVANGFICHNSGKDPTKVDRSASYMARYIAKNIVASGIADECEVQLAYCIGVAEPVSVMINTFGTAKIEEAKIEKAVREIFSLTPKGIIEELKLLRPIYRKTACYGHFGREGEGFAWEETDKVEELKRLLK